MDEAQRDALRQAQRDAQRQAQRDDHVAEDLGRERRPFTKMAQQITRWAGSAQAAVEAVLALSGWIGIGLLCRFPRWWEIGATVGLSFVTFLMLILVQHTQNHDDQAVQLKLDELIRASGGASNQMMRLEDAGQDDMARVRKAFDKHVSD